MPKQLTTQNATITTAAVEVKTLTISGKQVTLAVFRQLREEPLIAEDGTLNGVPWGIVNYHPDKCGDDYPHWHVVWQQGVELLRSRVDKIPPFDPDGVRRRTCGFARLEAADRFLTASVREWLAGRLDKAPLPTKKHQSYTVEFDDKRILNTSYDFRVYAVPSDVAVEAANRNEVAGKAVADFAKTREEMGKPLGPYAKAEWRQEALERTRRKADEANAERDASVAVLDAELALWGMSYRDITDAYAAATKAEAERRQRHRDTRTALAELPQLFIAV